MERHEEEVREYPENANSYIELNWKYVGGFCSEYGSFLNQAANGVSNIDPQCALCCAFLDPTSLRVYDLEHLERISFGPQSMGNCEDVSIFNLPSLKTIHFYDHSLQDCKKVIINSRVR